MADAGTLRDGEAHERSVLIEASLGMRLSFSAPVDEEFSLPASMS